MIYLEGGASSVNQLSKNGTVFAEKSFKGGRKKTSHKIIFLLSSILSQAYVYLKGSY
jgi:hypothetical protein